MNQDFRDRVVRLEEKAQEARGPIENARGDNTKSGWNWGWFFFGIVVPFLAFSAISRLDDLQAYLYTIISDEQSARNMVGAVALVSGLAILVSGFLLSRVTFNVAGKKWTKGKSYGAGAFLGIVAGIGPATIIEKLQSSF